MFQDGQEKLSQISRISWKKYPVFKKWENGKEPDIAMARLPGYPKYDWRAGPRVVVV